MALYKETIIKTDKSDSSAADQQRLIKIGNPNQPPIPMPEYESKYPCETRHWNLKQECDK